MNKLVQVINSSGRILFMVDTTVLSLPEREWRAPVKLVFEPAQLITNYPLRFQGIASIEYLECMWFHWDVVDWPEDYWWLVLLSPEPRHKVTGLGLTDMRNKWVPE